MERTLSRHCHYHYTRRSFPDDDSAVHHPGVNKRRSQGMIADDGQLSGFIC